MEVDNPGRRVASWKPHILRIFALIVTTAPFVYMELPQEYRLYRNFLNFICSITVFHIMALLVFSEKLMQFSKYLSLVGVFSRILCIFYIYIVKEIPLDSLGTDDLLINEKFDNYGDDVYVHIFPPRLNMIWIDVAHALVVFFLIAEIVSSMEKQTIEKPKKSRRRRNKATAALIQKYST